MVQPPYRDRRVFLTGHTGFMGSWLTLLLQRLGAAVTGFSLADPPSRPSLWQLLEPDKPVTQGFGDIRDRAALWHHLQQCQPELIIHLAAQPLVGEGFREPATTFDINVMGTVTLLDLAARLPSLKAVMVVTSDKAYQNPGGSSRAIFREADPLGSNDPYSTSKAAQDWVVQSYGAAKLSRYGIGWATLRVGNVIGGGDFGRDRLIPDLVQALVTRQPLRLRYPDSVRPWQHVLEPLVGYLLLGLKLLQNPAAYSGAWNFGPHGQPHTVGDLVQSFCRAWGANCSLELTPPAHPEMPYLMITSEKAAERLGWSPAWDFDTTVHHTAEWYRCWAESATRSVLTARALHSIDTMLETRSSQPLEVEK